MGIKKISFTSSTTSTNTQNAIPDLSNSSWYYLLDVKYADTDGNTITLYDGDDDERYSYTSGATSIVDQLEPKYVIKGPVDYKDSDSSGNNVITLHVRDVGYGA